MTNISLPPKHCAKDNADRIALDTGDSVPSNPKQETPTVVISQHIMGDMNLHEREQASRFLRYHQPYSRERLSQSLRRAAQYVASSVDTVSPPSWTHLPPTAPTTLKEDQHASPPPPGSKGTSPPPANAPIVALSEQAEPSSVASLMAGWVCRFKFWVGVTLTPLYGLLRLVLLYCLPGLGAALLGLIVCLFVIILLWNAALFAVQGVHHRMCSNGLGKVTPWLSAPGLGFGDSCSISETHVRVVTQHALGEDPSGLLAMTKWDVSGTGLIVARGLEAQISADIAQLVANTEAWEHRLHDGKQIHKFAVGYQRTHDAAEDQLDSLFANHTDFIQSLMFDVQFLSHHIDAQIESHGRSWSWMSLLAACLSRTPILRRWTPLGMLERDFKTFAEHHIPKLEGLSLQASRLRVALKTDRLSRKKLAKSVNDEWEYFDATCLSTSPAYLGGLIPSRTKLTGQMPYCHEWDHRKLRTLLQNDIGEWLESVETFATQSLTGYDELKQHYAKVVTALNNDPRKKNFKLDTTIAYRIVLESIRTNMIVSMIKLQQGLDGQVISPFSK